MSNHIDNVVDSAPSVPTTPPAVNGAIVSRETAKTAADYEAEIAALEAKLAAAETTQKPAPVAGVTKLPPAPAAVEAAQKRAADAIADAAKPLQNPPTTATPLSPADAEAAAKAARNAAWKASRDAARARIASGEVNYPLEQYTRAILGLIKGVAKVDKVTGERMKGALEVKVRDYLRNQKGQSVTKVTEFIEFGLQRRVISRMARAGKMAMLFDSRDYKSTLAELDADTLDAMDELFA